MITYGADPELFIWDYNKKVVVTPDSIGFFNTLDNTFRFIEGNITKDGTAIELNPKHFLSYQKEKLVASTYFLIDQVRIRLRNLHTKDRDYDILIEPIIGEGSKFPLKTGEKFNFTTRPSWDAYDGREIYEKTKEDWITTRRSGAGHIHIGISNKYEKTGETFYKTGEINTPEDLHFYARQIIIFLDYYVAAPLAFLSRKEEFLRREKYGKAGSYRKPAHGLEYRVLSNEILANKDLFKVCLDKIDRTVQWAIRHPFELDGRLNQLNKIFSQEYLCKLINTGEKSSGAARDIQSIQKYINRWIGE